MLGYHSYVGNGRRRHRGGRRHLRGRGLMDILKKAHSFVKSNQLISRGASALAPLVASRLGPNAANVLAKVGSVASSAGYGRRRRMHSYGGRRMYHGRGINLAGGALRLAGM